MVVAIRFRGSIAHRMGFFLGDGGQPRRKMARSACCAHGRSGNLGRHIREKIAEHSCTQAGRHQTIVQPRWTLVDYRGARYQSHDGARTAGSDAFLPRVSVWNTATWKPEFSITFPSTSGTDAEIS